MKTRRKLASMCLALSCGALFTAANVSVGDQPGVIRMTSGQEPLQPPAVPPPGGETPVPDAGVTTPQDGTGDAGTVFLDAPPATQQAPQFTPPVDFQQMVQRSAGVTEAPVLGRRPFDNAPFGPLVQFETNTDDGLGFDQSFHTANVRMPYHIIPGNTVLMADLSASVTNNGQGAYNFGAIYRNYDELRNRIFGWNAYFDMDDGRGNEQWQRVGFGFESLGKYFDVRANGYYIAGDETVLLQDQLVGDLGLMGSGVFRIRNQVRDNAYGGADFEVGGPLPVLGRRGLNLYGGGYYLDSEYGNETVGFQARFEALITESLTVNVNLTNDDTFGTNSWVSIAYTIPSYRERAILQPRRVRDRLQDPVIRSRRVHSNLDRIDLPEFLVNTTKGRQYRFIHVDPNATTTSNGGLGLGTVEDPFTNLQAAVAANDPAVDVIRIIPRADDTGTNLTVPGGITLHDCQALIASTKDFTLFTENGMDFNIPAVPTATNLGPLVQDPNMLAGGSVIRIANENQILGLRIDASNTGGTVFGTGISNPLPFTDTSIVMNTFTNYTNAIDLQNGSGTIIIDQNMMNGTSGTSQSGLLLTTANGSTTDLLLRGNQVDTNGNVGLSVTTGLNSTLNADNIAGVGGTTTGILDNVVDGNGTTTVGSTPADGIVVTAQAGSRANVAAENNTSSNNTGNGFVARADGGIFNLVSLRNNTFDSNTENGAFLHYLNGGRFFAVSEDINEDLNFNGVLDPGEDLNGDGVLQAANGILDLGEDLNGNGILDQGIVSNTFSNNTIAGLCIFGEDGGEGIFDIGGPATGLGNTMIGNLGAGIAVDLQDTATARLDTLNNFISSDPNSFISRPPSLTFVLDFWEASQGAFTDALGGFPIDPFDVTAFGFAATDFDLVTSNVLQTIENQFYGIPTISQDPRSPMPDGQQLDIDFVIGNLGEAPSNGATEFYTIVIGDTTGATNGTAGLGFLGIVRDALGNGPNFGAANGDNVASVYTSEISQIPGANVGDILTTRNAIANVTSHEIGHTLSLEHLNVNGSVTPDGGPPVMFTGAIDATVADFLTEAEFAYSGQNAENGNAAQFHVAQLISAVGTRTAATAGVSGDGISINAIGSARLLPSTFINNTIQRNDGTGIEIAMNENARAEGVTIQGNTIGANSSRGIDLVANGPNAFIDADGTIGGTGMNILGGTSFNQGNIITGNMSDGIRALASNGGIIHGNALNNEITANTGNGISLHVDGSGFIDFGTPASNRLISGNTITGNGGVGIDIVSRATAMGNSQVNAVIRNNIIDGNVGGGISSQMFGQNMGGVTNNLVNLTVGGNADQANSLTGNSNFGIRFDVAGNSKGIFDFSNSTISGTLDGADPFTSGDGLVLTRSDASLLMATINNVTSTNNAGNGMLVDVQGNDRFDINQPMSGTANTIVWNNNTFADNGINGALFRTRGDSMLLADGVGNILSNNTANGALVESSEFSSFGDATQGLPPGRRTLWDGFVADSNGIDGIGVVATEGSRVLLEITSNRLAGSSNAHAGLNTNGDTTISNNGNDGVGIVTTGGTSDILITSGTGQTTLSGNGTQGGGNGIRWDASGNSDGTVRADSLIITGSIAGASETVANLNNGILDPGEDINGNGILDQGEDTDNNQDLDTENGDGIQANFADNSVATLQIGGVGAGNIIQNNEDDGIAITATGTGALLSSTAAGESVPRPIISMQENLVGGEDNGVAAGNGGDGFSLNVLGDIASNAQLLSDPANVDTDLAGGLFGNTDGVQQSGPIVQISADNNQFTRNGRIGVNLRLNGAAGERDRENGNSTFDPVRLTFTNNTISSNTLEGVFLRADSDMNQGRFTYLPNFPFPNPPFNPADQRPQVFGFYDPLQPEFNAQNIGSVNGNTAFLPTASDGAPGFLNLRTVQNSFLTLTGNTIQNNGTGTVTGEGLVLEVGTGAYLAADVRNNEFGGNLEEDVRTASFLSAGNTFASVDVTGATTLDVVYHDDTAQLDMRFTNNAGNQIAINSAGATYTDADALKAIVLGLGVTSRSADLFQVDDGGNLDNPNNRFVNFNITQDIDGAFATGGFNLRAGADPMFPNIGFAPFLP